MYLIFEKIFYLKKKKIFIFKNKFSKIRNVNNYLEI